MRKKTNCFSQRKKKTNLELRTAFLRATANDDAGDDGALLRRDETISTSAPEDIGASTAGLPDATAEEVVLGLAREGEDERAGGGGGGDAEAPLPSAAADAAATELCILGRRKAAGRPTRPPRADVGGRARERMAALSPIDEAGKESETKEIRW